MRARAQVGGSVSRDGEPPTPGSFRRGNFLRSMKMGARPVDMAALFCSEPPGIKHPAERGAGSANGWNVELGRHPAAERASA